MARKGENIYKRKDGRWVGRYIKSRSSTGKANYGYVRQNTESGMSLDELSQNPVLDDTIRSYYNNPVQVAQVGSYYVFQSDGRHRTLAAQSLDTYIPVLVTGSYTRND